MAGLLELLSSSIDSTRDLGIDFKSLHEAGNMRYRKDLITLLVVSYCVSPPLRYLSPVIR